MMPSGTPRTRRDQYRVWKRIHSGIRRTSELAEQLGLSEQQVREIKCDGCELLWAFLLKEHQSALIDEMCSRD